METPALPARPEVAVDRPITRRTAQRGAAIFVVMMAILLLSGMGMWAMHSASLVDRASGYERTALQAQYVSEMGLIATSSYLSLPSMAAVNFKLGERAYGTSGDACESIPSSVTATFCKSLWMTDINDATTDSTSQVVTVDTTAKGSFSPFANEVQGDFTVEMTSPRRAIVPGSPLTEDSPYRLVTLTSYGTVRPHTGSAVNGNLCAVGSTSSAPQNASAGRIAVRSHAIIGPIE